MEKALTRTRKHKRSEQYIRWGERNYLGFVSSSVDAWYSEYKLEYS